jgi:hypothetical protein
MYLGIFSINDIIYFRINTVNKNGSAIDATVTPSFQVFGDDSETAITSGVMDKIYSEEGTYEGSFTASSASYSTGQHFILLDATVDGETPKAHITFQLVRESQSIEETFQEIQLIGEQVPSIGEGSISVDHNFGSVDNFRVTANGTPLADVEIRAFVASDYSAGRKSNTYVVGQTRTLTDGRWATVIRLDPAAYTLEFSKTGAFRTTTADITVTGVMSMSFETMSFDSMSFDSMAAEEPQDVAQFSISSADNMVYIDHDFENKDNMRLVAGGKPITGADIRIYLKSDYDLGKLDEDHVVQRTSSRSDGRWAKRLQVTSNRKYIVHFSKKGAFKSHTKVIRV